MKIDNQQTSGAQLLSTGKIQRSPNQVAAGANVQTQNAPDEFTLSAHASLVAQALTANSPGRLERVANIAREFNQGSYAVDAPAVSQAIVQDSLQSVRGSS
jgi:anti-sigma28 factor (negative regulator of flagellin synthesis)